jgi:hypothetical protein
MDDSTQVAQMTVQFQRQDVNPDRVCRFMLCGFSGETAIIMILCDARNRDREPTKGRP